MRRGDSKTIAKDITNNAPQRQKNKLAFFVLSLKV